VLPLIAGLLVGVLTGALFDPVSSEARPSAAPIFAALGASAMLLGVAWYGLKGLGLRGKRPLFAGIGFAVLGWVAVLAARFLPMWPTVRYNELGQAVVEVTLFLEVIDIRSEGAGRAYFYYLLFEAFATQIWAFGLAFRALADWRGPLAAAVGSGVLFGMVGFLLFQESFVPHWSTFLYFLLWGVFYGMIRLRTGSVIGPIIVQSLQSFTAWFVFQPPGDVGVAQLRAVYLFASILFAIFIWRLWPRREGDYRI
jgi:membrane protease YdiL (CAAX protease family)